VTVPDSGATRRRRFGSASRLAAFLAILLAVILSVTAYETGRAFANQSVASTTRSLVSEVDSFSRSTDGTTPGMLESATVDYLQGRVLVQGESLIVGLPSGRRFGSSGSAPLLATSDVRRLLATPPARTTSYRRTLDGSDTLLLVSPIHQGGATVGTLIVASDLSQLHADQKRVIELGAGEALVALVAAVAGAYLLLRRLLRTVGSITDTAASIESGDLDRRLGDQGTDDEVGKLAATFDSMLDRLQAAMVVQRRLLSDVSHQLRTPLTVARGHLEVLARQPHADMAEVRDTVAVVVDELDHMRSLVERLLLLGRALEPDFLEVERLDLRTFLSDLTDSARVLAPRHWALAPVPDVVLEVDVAKLRGALLNLVDNAVGATTPDDAVEVRAVRSPLDGSIVLSVEDSGPGIPDAQLPTVLARFGRLGSADRQGSGLGLAIVTAVAEAHGGTFALGRSELGGCRAAITLPRTRVTMGVERAPVGV
jgi:signal transduction histidine kinase